VELDNKMAEPVRSDEPLSSVRFPESPSRKESSPPRQVPITQAESSNAQQRLPEHATQQPLGEWPAEVRERRYVGGRERDFSKSEDVGTALGSAVQKVSGFMQDRMQNLKHRFRVIRGRAQSGELQEDLKSRASDVADEASRRARQARTRAEYFANNYPLQFIAGAAVAGFAVGFLLRMWRDE
jgi:ElaB/YqjD/DUF883 family membrane-anchored ribosome-binding protein